VIGRNALAMATGELNIKPRLGFFRQQEFARYIIGLFSPDYPAVNSDPLQQPARAGNRERESYVRQAPAVVLGS
jgi:hypothetical protein